MTFTTFNIFIRANYIFEIANYTYFKNYLVWPLMYGPLMIVFFYPCN